MRENASPTEFSDQAPNPALALTFVVLLAILCWQQLDSAMRVFQRFLLSAPEAKGLIGQYFDLEPLHLAYSVAILWFLLLVYRLSGAHRPNYWTQGMSAWWLITIALIIQGYHAIEHFFRLWQFIQSGLDDTPGILGNAVDPILLHFLASTLTFLPVVAAFWFGGFHRGTGEGLRTAWNDLTGRPVGLTAAGRRPHRLAPDTVDRRCRSGSGHRNRSHRGRFAASSSPPADFYGRDGAVRNRLYA